MLYIELSPLCLGLAYAVPRFLADSARMSVGAVWSRAGLGRGSDVLSISSGCDCDCWYSWVPGHRNCVGSSARVTVFLASARRHLFPRHQHVDLTSPVTRYMFLSPKGVLTTHEFVIHFCCYLEVKNTLITHPILTLSFPEVAMECSTEDFLRLSCLLC